MTKYIVTYLQEVAEKLNCELNYALDGFDTTLYWIIKTKTEKGNYPCPCTVPENGRYKTFCPCKEWVQKVKKGEAETGDKCHCELFEKV